MASKKDSLTIAWCDGGMTDGKFTQGLVYTILQAHKAGYKVDQALRVHGNQIGRQRQVLIDGWYDKSKTDWILWVDSDIELTMPILDTLWEAANPVIRPVVSGVYFISKQPEGTLTFPLPALFNDITEFSMQHVHPLPENELIKVDSAGMGLVLMHRSVMEKLRAEFPTQSVFAEQEGRGNEYVSEDIVFFRNLKKIGVPVYAHTGAIGTHVKRFNLDADYYNLFWKNYVDEHPEMRSATDN